MIELVYMSQAQYILNDAELVEMLEIARRNNTSRGITGMLLYDGVGTFVQAIEGEQNQIDELYEIIAQDPRHGGIQQLSYSEVSERSFADWRMGYKRITDEDSNKLQGYSNFMTGGENDNTALNSGFGLELLHHFRQTSDK